MKLIDIRQIPERFHKIALQNGRDAVLRQAMYARVKEVDPNNDIIVYKYKVPCPVCDHESLGHSYDGKFFNNIQINCRHCGVYFRPVIKR